MATAATYILIAIVARPLLQPAISLWSPSLRDHTAAFTGWVIQVMRMPWHGACCSQRDRVVGMHDRSAPSGLLHRPSQNIALHADVVSRSLHDGAQAEEVAGDLLDDERVYQDNLASFTLSGCRQNDDAVSRQFFFERHILTSLPVLIDAADPQRSVSGELAHQLVISLCGAFEPDSTVCLHLYNDVLYPVLVLAILASRCRWTGTNPAYTAAELSHHFRLSKTRSVVTSLEHLETVQTAVKSLDADIEVILFTDLLLDIERCQRVAGLRTLHDLLREGSESACKPSRGAIQIRNEAIAALMPTSGTTGLPKLAARTHRSMIAELLAIAEDDSQKPYTVRRVLCTPSFHAFTAPEMLFNALRLGRLTYIMRRFDETFALKVHAFRITEIFAPPAVLSRLAKSSQDHGRLQTVRYVAYGGATLGPNLRKQFLSLFAAEPRLTPVYGMTEGGWFTTLKHPEVDHSPTVGRPVRGYRVRVGPSATTLEDGQAAGELQVRGPQVMEGYFGDEKATEAAFNGDWLRTGDIGYIKDGKVYLVDRAKEIIKVNGFQVSPSEVQDALLQHADIQDAAVYGMGQDLDEHPLACVVRAKPDLTPDDIMTHLRGRLASYKVSKCEIIFVENIPKSAAGKVLKEELKALVSSLRA